MSEVISRAFKGVWIPRAIWLNRDLTPLQKMLLAEIDSLSGNGKGCCASNEYLAQFFHVTAGTMAHMITDLRKQGWIETLSFDGRTRRIRIKSALLESDKAETVPDVGIRQGSIVGNRESLLEENKVERKEGSNDLLSFKNQGEEVGEEKEKTTQKRKPRIGTVNGTKPELRAVVEFCEEIGLPKKDGEYMFHKWEGDGWARVKNWQSVIHAWRSAGYLPSQKNAPPTPRKLTQRELERAMGM